MSRLFYEQRFGNLPPAEGRNADIAKGLFTVVTSDGTVLLPKTDVMYDLVTRAPLSPTPWDAEQGTLGIVLRLAYVDDAGNQTAFTEHEFGEAKDTITPDAPQALGETVLLREEE
jgi:hypothetical protein